MAGALIGQELRSKLDFPNIATATVCIFIRWWHVMRKFSGVSYWLMREGETHSLSLHLCLPLLQTSTFTLFTSSHPKSWLGRTLSPSL